MHIDAQMGSRLPFVSDMHVQSSGRFGHARHPNTQRSVPVQQFVCGHSTGTPWAQIGHKQKRPLVSGRLLSAETASILVAREGFEPPTFGL